ncbi:unnamed protein product [Citrullus colocynthis]|uniref:Uncharacterized protein n=1 Tax=Citrullus colocynthis TaxID=252529 RepID=A0ABP0Y056_9ROSI
MKSSTVVGLYCTVSVAIDARSLNGNHHSLHWKDVMGDCFSLLRSLFAQSRVPPRSRRLDALPHCHSSHCCPRCYYGLLETPTNTILRCFCEIWGLEHEFCREKVLAPFCFGFHFSYGIIKQWIYSVMLYA